MSQNNSANLPNCPPDILDLGNYYFEISVIDEKIPAKQLFFYFFVPKLDKKLTNNYFELLAMSRIDFANSEEITDFKFILNDSPEYIAKNSIPQTLIKHIEPVGDMSFTQFIKQMTNQYVLPFIDTVNLAHEGKEKKPDITSFLKEYQREMKDFIESCEQRKLVSTSIEANFFDPLIEALSYRDKIVNFNHLDEDLPVKTSSTSRKKI